MTEEELARSLHEELRLMRIARGVSQIDLARKINYSDTTLSMIETGARKPPPGFWQRIDGALQTGGVFNRLAERLVTPLWKIEWTAAERAAVALRSYETLVVPGLLQTEAYARAVLTDASLTGPEEAERRVAERMARQEILTRNPPPQLTVVIDEGVLRRPLGGPAVMREQVEALIEACGKPHIRVHVVPSSIGGYIGLNGPFVIATAANQSVTGYLDNQLRGQVIDSFAEIAELQAAWEAVRGEALPLRQSIELMRDVAQTWN